MNYNGNWTNTKTGEVIRISNSSNSDEYLLEWNKSSHGFNKKQKIQISRGDINHSHLTYSERFGEVIITNIDDNTIEINEERYKKKTKY